LQCIAVSSGFSAGALDRSVYTSPVPKQPPPSAPGDTVKSRPFDPDVFDFLDYRVYLREFYRRRKEQTSFSYRAFSMRAKLKSPNYLKLVMDGERNLTAPMAKRFANACGLTGQAASFFVELVAFGQADTMDERNESYTRLKRYAQYREANRLQIAQDEYHSKWYLPATRELALAEDFQADPAWIAARLVPPIKVSEAKSALDTLQQLRMLVVDEKGRLRQGTPHVTTGAETASLHMVSYHRTMMQLASESLVRVPYEQRDISAVTLCLGRDGLEHVKQAIVRFRRELLKLSELEQNPRQVVQLNFQLFPLSSAGEDEE
jgi:uncharacterized protein (TIGR02147 family)